MSSKQLFMFIVALAILGFLDLILGNYKLYNIYNVLYCGFGVYFYTLKEVK